jgi:cobalt/nickel transport system ATP-binding protein
MMTLENVSAAYQGVPALQEITLRIDRGERVVLLGPNGSGKSTLLRVLNALVWPEHGAYRYEGELINRATMKASSLNRRFRNDVVYLFQSPDVMLFNPTVYDEIAFGIRQFGLDDEADRVHQWAERLAISHLLSRPPFRLSGGEKQKVCLAALLAIEPMVLLLDEPTASLDPPNVGWLARFLQRLPVTTVTATHQLDVAKDLGARALLLDGEHRLIFDGPAQELLKDRDTLARANLATSTSPALRAIDCAGGDTLRRQKHRGLPGG